MFCTFWPDHIFKVSAVHWLAHYCNCILYVIVLLLTFVDNNHLLGSEFAFAALLESFALQLLAALGMDNATDLASLSSNRSSILCGSLLYIFFVVVLLQVVVLFIIFWLICVVVFVLSNVVVLDVFSNVVEQLVALILQRRSVTSSNFCCCCCCSFASYCSFPYWLIDLRCCFCPFGCCCSFLMLYYS